jgi:hypothetical protein
MVADFAVVAESPGRAHVLLSFIEIAFGKVNPAERVPISDQRRDQRNILLGEPVEAEIAQRRSGRRDGGLGVLLGFIQMRAFERELVRNVVPDERRGGEFNGVVKGRESFVVLPEI